MMDDRIKGLNLKKYSYSEDIQIEDFSGKMRENLKDRFNYTNEMIEENSTRYFLCLMR